MLLYRQPAQASARPERMQSGSATLADEIASAQNGAGPLMGNIRKPDAREALAYVRAHSPDEAQLLVGLSKFVERWLEQVHAPILLTPSCPGIAPHSHTLHANLSVPTRQWVCALVPSTRMHAGGLSSVPRHC